MENGGYLADTPIEQIEAFKIIASTIPYMQPRPTAPSAPGAAWDAPGTARVAPGAAWNAPGTARGAPGAAWGAPETARSAPGAAWGAHGAAWGAPGSARGEPWGAPGSARGAHGTAQRHSSSMGLIKSFTKLAGAALNADANMNGGGGEEEEEEEEEEDFWTTTEVEAEASTHPALRLVCSNRFGRLCQELQAISSSN